jgi:hypothetical protein
LVEIEQTPGKPTCLRPSEGLNFPGTALQLDALTSKDLADLDSVAEFADIVGYSFVQRREDLAWLQDELAKRTPRADKIAIQAKIETAFAVRNLPALILQGAGRQPFAFMIARGDLAVELGYQRLAEIQEELLWLCEAAHVPVVSATQVMDSFVRTGLPVRGELTDAAMAERGLRDAQQGAASPGSRLSHARHAAAHGGASVEEDQPAKSVEDLVGGWMSFSAGVGRLPTAPAATSWSTVQRLPDAGSSLRAEAEHWRLIGQSDAPLLRPLLHREVMLQAQLLAFFDRRRGAHLIPERVTLLLRHQAAAIDRFPLSQRRSLRVANEGADGKRYGHQGQADRHPNLH